MYVALTFFKALFKVSTNLSACPLDLRWYEGIVMCLIWYVSLRSLNSPDVNRFLLSDTKVSTTLNLANSSCRIFIIISVIFASMYFSPLWETVNYIEVVISFQRAGEVNGKSVFVFNRGCLGCQGTAFTWFDSIFYIFFHVWPMDIAMHQTFHSSIPWVASMEIFQDTLLESWRIPYTVTPHCI